MSKSLKVVIYGTFISVIPLLIAEYIFPFKSKAPTYVMFCSIFIVAVVITSKFKEGIIIGMISVNLSMLVAFFHAYPVSSYTIQLFPLAFLRAVIITTLLGGIIGAFGSITKIYLFKLLFHKFDTRNGQN